jgi:hypothetical protein
LSKHIAALSIGILIVLAGALPQENTDEEIIERTAERVAAYPELPDMEVEAVALLIEMDKHWKPKKRTEVEKTVRMVDGLRVEDITKATEHRKGRAKDVTGKFRNDARKNAEKARKRRAKQGPDDSEGGGGHRELSMDQMFPFGPEKRAGYDFSRKGSSYVGRRSVYVMEARSKARSDKFVEGLYYIDRETFDVLQVELRFAKNPRMVKRFEMEALFRVLPEGYLVMSSSRVRIHVGLVVKNIRMEASEEYREYRILN